MIASLHDPPMKSGPNNPIQSLWVGNALSSMELLCLHSFLAHGHDFHLYAYDQPANLPNGITLIDAESILPRQAIFKYIDRDTYAGFSDLFRYKLLLERGGIWVDTDMVCLRPFCFDQPFLFASAPYDGITSCVIKTTAGSPVMQTCYQETASKDRRTIRWGVIGPRLVSHAVHHHGLLDAVASEDTFCPLSYPEYDLFTEEGSAELLETRLANSHAVHLWNEMWRVNQLDKNARYDENTLYEVLKQKYLPAGG